MLTPRQRAVLAALRRGPVDPSALGDRLELPSSAVVSHVDALCDHGFEIERGRHGFVLESVPEYGYGVQAGLDARFVVDYHRTLPSTNDRARELAARGETDVAVVADEQTTGRGRFDRAWRSPPGGVYCSVLVRPSLPSDRVPLVTLAAAVAAVESATALGVEAGCKWPNDLQGPDGRKLAGVLAESSSAGGTVDWVVVGLGLNADIDPADLPASATSLSELTGGPVDRRAIVQRYLESFDEWRSAPARIVDAYRDHSTTIGQRVRVRTGDTELVGRAIDVDETGALLVEADDGTHTVSAGECVHLRSRA